MFPFASGAPSVSAFSAWNPLDKGATAVLTSANTILNSNASNTSGGARGQISRNSGNRYVEFKAGAATDSGFYLGGSGANLTSYTGPAKLGIVASQFSYTPFSFGSFGEPFALVTPTLNDVIGFAYDASTGNIFISVNGTFYDFDGLGYDSTIDTSRPTTQASISTVLFPLGIANQTNANLFINTNPSSRPSGYTNWG